MLASARRGIQYPNPDRSDRPDIPAHILYLVNALEIDVIYAQGTHAARPGAPGYATGGYVYWETDTNLLFYWNGSAYVQVGVTSAGINLSGTIASRPAANSVVAGTSYFATDTGLTYRSDGASWTLTGSTPAGENGSGTLGARPGAATVPAGYVYFATDNGLAYRSDGAAWTLISSVAGAELDYVQITADTSAIAVTTEGTATAVLTGASVAYDGTKNRIEVWLAATGANAGAFAATLVLFRDAVVVGQSQISISNSINPYPFSAFDTPSAGSHVYKVAAFVSANSITVKAGLGGSGNRLASYMRVTKA